MQRFMLSMSGFLSRHGRLVLVAWVVLLLAALPFAARQSEDLTGGGFLVPGSQSEHVLTALPEEFPAVAPANLSVLVEPQAQGTAALLAALERVRGAADEVEHVSLAPAALARAREQAQSPAPLLVPLTLTVGEDTAQDVASDLREEIGIGKDSAAAGIHLIGQGALWAGMQDLTKSDLESAEKAGFPIVLIILLVVFGSFAAAALPLALGVVAVMVTGSLIFALSQTLEMSVFVTNMASMIGIGVAVDYSLFILARYREEIREGASPDAARSTAMATSGTAVLFSGLTVMISLAGLWMVDNQALRSMALGAILVVAIAVLAALTLLPALIKAFGHRAHARSRMFTIAGLLARSRSPRRPGSTRPGAAQLGFWERWTRLVTSRPVPTAIAAAALMLVLAAPVLDLETREGALHQFPAGHETRAGFERANELFGAGGSTPTQVLVEFRKGTVADPANAAVLGRLRTELSSDPAVSEVARPVPSRDGGAALLAASLKPDHESAAAKAAVERMREALPPAAGAAAAVSVGGVSAAQLDIGAQIDGSMWKIMLFVLGLSYIVLLILLRSVILPLKAVLMNLLSVGAAYGVLVAVFQWGWFSGLVGTEPPGFIDTLNPPLILAVVFGLSMDYEVFLLSRIKERYDAHGDSRRAVAEGLAASARTITSAAVIMVAVFLVFVGTGVPSIKEIGLGTAVAVALDATLVRLVLVPATMEILGDWNWWLPGPLARILPRTNFERAPAAAEAAA